MMRSSIAILAIALAAPFAHAEMDTRAAGLALLPNHAGIIAEWQCFGDGGDSSGRGHTGSASNGARFLATTIDIPTTTSRVVIADADALTPADFTIAFWVLTPGITEWPESRMISKESSTTNRSWYVGCGNKKPRLLVSSDGSNHAVYEPVSIPRVATTWMHIAMTHKASVTNTIWFDGAQVPGFYVLGSPQGPTDNNTAYLAIGCDQRQTPAQIGRYGRIYFYDRVLQKEEIELLYQEGPPE